MKNNTKYWQSSLAMIGVVLGLAIVPVSRAMAENPNPGVFPPDENVSGMTYGDWSAAWWQYLLTIPTNTNPSTTGLNCGIGQSTGPVFFLTGAPTSAQVTRECTVSTKKALFFPIINIECSTVESAPFHGNNGQELRTCAAGFADGIGVDTLKVTVDGIKLQRPGLYRAQSPLFDFIMPAADNFLGVPGVTSGSSVSDGYWVMLKPLSPGQHVLHFKGEITSGPGEGFSQDVTYHLTITE